MIDKRFVLMLCSMNLLALACCVPTQRAAAGIGLQVSTGGSVSQPAGQWNDEYETGWRGQLALTVIPPHASLRFRLSWSYSQYDRSQPDPEEPPSSFVSLSFSGEQLEVLWLPFRRLSSHPYVFAGYGSYSVKREREKLADPPTIGNTFTDQAWDTGLGIEIPWRRMAIMGEATYFHFTGDNSFGAFYLTAGIGYSIK